MKSVITGSTLRSFCYTNAHLVKKASGILLEFMGLGFRDMFNSDSGRDRSLAEEGIVRVVPYYSPWAWMNPSAVAFTPRYEACLRAPFRA